MSTYPELNALLQELIGRLAKVRSVPKLRELYLDLVPVTAQLQAAVGECLRANPQRNEARQAGAAFDRHRAQSRQVGLDIRLASPSALSMGLQAALESAEEALSWLARCS